MFTSDSNALLNAEVEWFVRQCTDILQVRAFLKSAGESSSLLDRIGKGIADHEKSPSAAWFAVQNRQVWPQIAVPHIWRGVLVSALEGRTLARAAFWDDFAIWHSETQDVECRNLLSRAGVTISPVVRPLLGT